MDPRAEEGSFADRLKKLTLQPLELLKVLKEEVDSMAVAWSFDEDVQTLEVSCDTCVAIPKFSVCRTFF
jgi:hypothetical protein